MPSVAVAYNMEEWSLVKEVRGFVTDHLLSTRKKDINEKDCVAG